MTSGTLAYSFGLGKAVVSTPYWHARELLADGRGILVPFGDATAIGSEIAGLLTDDARRQAMRKRAYASSRSMTWERTAERYLAAFESARRGHRLRVDCAARPKRSPRATGHAPPEMQIGHLLSMCDDTGLFQHAIHSVPDRSHGYCVDDNARALLLACALNNPGEQRLPETLTARLAAFVQHAWNPDTQAVSQLHELRSTLARRQRLGGQPWADALGLGRVCPQRCQSVAAAMGRRAVRRSAADGGELSLAARLGLHAARVGRLLRRRCGGFRCRARPTSPCGQIDVPSCRRSRPRTGCGSRKGLPTTMRACRRP